VNKSYRGRSCPIIVHCRYVQPGQISGLINYTAFLLKTSKNTLHNPLLIICLISFDFSDGAGRTGTYCLIDMVLNRMTKGAKEIDIAASLEHIRDQRPGMVRTKQQFEFVLMAVAEEVHAILKALPQ